MSATRFNVISLIRSEKNHIPFISLSHCLFYCSLPLTVCIAPNLSLSFSNMLGTVDTKSTHIFRVSVNYLPAVLVCFTLCCVSYLCVITIGFHKIWTFVSLSRYRFKSPPPHPRLAPRDRSRDLNQFNRPAGRLNSSWLSPARAGNSQLHNAPVYKRSYFIWQIKHSWGLGYTQIRIITHNHTQI